MQYHVQAFAGRLSDLSLDTIERIKSIIRGATVKQLNDKKIVWVLK